ncbi:hypothetical protein O3P69_006555 [Scylla paramamosain]|uniref:Uncharacterized protein n=1 Tax=Scylla paramamosain TaxID=85552 RepID=A0AAW0U2Z6_SCYPA
MRNHASESKKHYRSLHRLSLFCHAKLKKISEKQDIASTLGLSVYLFAHFPACRSLPLHRPACLPACLLTVNTHIIMCCPRRALDKTRLRSGI